MKKNYEAMADMLDEPDNFNMGRRAVASALRAYVPQVYPEKGPLPNSKYFQYYLKTTFDTRLWIDAPAWTAGGCYRFDNGVVQIWCGSAGHYTVYEYPSMSKTHNWMLD